MTKGTVLFAIMALAAVLGWAQQPASTTTSSATAAPTQGVATSSIPDGTIVKVEIKQTVETQKVKVGDPVKIEVIEDGRNADGKTALGPDGKPAIPRKTKLTAQVTSVKASTKENRDAKLSLVVTRATFPNGKTMPFLGVVMGPFKVSSLSSGTGIDTAGGAGFSKQKLEGPSVPSGIASVDIKIDPQLGTVLVGRNNFSVDNGTEFHVRYVDPAAHPAEPQPPKK